jgi:hypothetical protein
MGWRNLGSWCAAAGLAFLLIWGLRWLAHAQLDAFLTQKAQMRLELISHGSTPYRWTLRSSDDLIAGRVFGVDKFDFDAQGLRLLAGADAFEIGFPLNNEIIDLRRFTRLRLRVLAQAPLERCELVLRPAVLDAEMKTPLALMARGENEEIPLAALAWFDDSGANVAPPTRAASLRLRVLAPVGTAFHLDALAFLPDPKLSEAGLLARSLAGATHASPGLADLPVPASATTLPIVDFSSAVSNEAALAYFDRLRQHEPAALLVPQPGMDALQATSSPPKPAWSESTTRWIVAMILGTALLALRLFPPRRPRLRTMLELTAVLAPALVVVIGGWLGDNLDAPLATALVFIAAFAFCLPRVQPWGWIGNWRTWLLPGLAVIAALLLAGILGDHLKLRGATVLFRYLAWTAMQQYLVCVVVTDRCRVLGLGDRWTVVFAAAVFALLHTPNETLMLATFGGGLLWVTAWRRDRRLLPIVFSHALSAVIVFSTLPVDVLRSAEVSLRFLLS